MPKTIIQKITFRNTKPKALFELYMNAKKHSLAIGAPANISAKAGTKFSVHGDYITGINLLLVKDKLIVQSWRASDWEKSDLDSTFSMYLDTTGKDVVVHVIHSNVPDQHASSIDQGWHDYYWKPWKKYLAGKPIQPQGM